MTKEENDHYYSGFQSTTTQKDMVVYAYNLSTHVAEASRSL